MNLGQMRWTESTQDKWTGLSQTTFSLGDGGSQLGPSPPLPREGFGNVWAAQGLASSREPRMILSGQ